MREPSNAITFVTGQLGIGGAEKQLYLLATSLHRRGWNVSVVTLNGNAGDYWETPFRESGLALESIAAGTPKAYRVYAVAQLLRKHRPTIVHSWTMFANPYAALAGRIAGVRFRLGSERSNPSQSLDELGRFWYSQCLRGLDAIVMNSHAAMTFVNAFRPGLKTFVVHNGIEVPHAHASDLRAALRTEFKIPHEVPVIGCIGRLEQRKNFRLALAAAACLLNRFPNLHVVFVGEGPLRSKLEQEAYGLMPRGSIHFLGAIPRAARLVPMFDVFVFPSKDQEGMPNVLMEASAFGVPSVATRVGAVEEIIEDGKTGFTVGQDAPEPMAEKIAALLCDPTLRIAMGNAARMRVSRGFGIETMVTNMERVYDEIRRHVSR